MTHLRKHRKSQLSSCVSGVPASKLLDNVQRSVLGAVRVSRWLKAQPLIVSAFRRSTFLFRPVHRLPLSPHRPEQDALFLFQPIPTAAVWVGYYLLKQALISVQVTPTVYTLGCAWTTLALHFEHVPSAVRRLRSFPRSGRAGILSGHASHWGFHSDVYSNSVMSSEAVESVERYQMSLWSFRDKKSCWSCVAFTGVLFICYHGNRFHTWQ